MTQRSPLPMIRRMVNRFLFGWPSRWHWNVVAPAGALAGLWAFEDRVVEIDAVLGFKIVGIGRRPMLIQRRTDCFSSCCG